MRSKSGYRVTYPTGSRQRFFLASPNYLRAYLSWFHACPPDVQAMAVTVSDGDQPSQATFSPSASGPKQITIPDPHFFDAVGFASERALAANETGWANRADEIVWRGLPNGFGRLSFTSEAIADRSVNARLRLVMGLSGHAGTDVKFSGVIEEVASWEPTLRSLGHIGRPQAPHSWLERKYAIDIDGYANTWSNFLVRMLFGCCVFKVESQFGFRQWYYDRITPFEHYVPVRADMSDLVEKIDWARSHQNQAREIAAAGQRFAMALDFEAGKRDAVEIISANWDKR